MNRFFLKLYFNLPLALALLFAPVFSVSAIDATPAKNPLERLIQGNQRYVTSTTVCHNDWAAKRAALLENQKPFAVIVACSDSRVPPEIVFDQSLGGIFLSFGLQEISSMILRLEASNMGSISSEQTWCLFLGIPIAAPYRLH